MKKLKYLITIIVICIIVFIGIEVFRKTEHEEEITNTNTNATQGQNIATSNNTETEKTEELKNGEELMQKAEKTLIARGWAGASNNVIGIKDGVIYYYNQGTGEFYKIATGIEDIYYKTDDSEEITAKQGKNVEKFGKVPEFLIFE